MRHALLRRRRRGGNPLTAKYQSILAESPTLLHAMEGAALTEWEGVPIYYADAAGTTPVYAVGDPVGGLLDLVSGTITTTQGIDGNRPVLGLDSVIFDKDSSNDLVASFAATGGDPHSVAMSLSLQAGNVGNERAYGGDSVNSNIRLRSSNLDGWNIRNSGTAQIVLSAPITLDKFGTLTGVHDQPAIVRYDGTEDTEDIGAPANISTIHIGSRTGGDYISASVKTWMYFNRALTPTERQDLEALL